MLIVHIYTRTCMSACVPIPSTHTTTSAQYETVKLISASPPCFQSILGAFGGNLFGLVHGSPDRKYIPVLDGRPTSELEGCQWPNSARSRGELAIRTSDEISHQSFMTSCLGSIWISMSTLTSLAGGWWGVEDLVQEQHSGPWDASYREERSMRRSFIQTYFIERDWGRNSPCIARPDSIQHLCQCRGQPFAHGGDVR